MSVLVASASPPLRGSILVPGDKSISHRALILGALAEGETRITGLLESDDVLSTAAAVRAFGAKAETDGDVWRVRGREWRSPGGIVDCGNSGTGVRLLAGAAAGFPIEVTFTGDESLRSRPMGRVLDPLKAMGANVEGGERLPFTLRGGGLSGISWRSPAASAQIKSAVLLAGLRAEGEVELIEPARSRDHSERMMRAFGAEVESDGLRVRLGAKRRLHGIHVAVPGDPSSAAFPLVAALIVPGSEVTVRDLLVNPLRTGLYDTLTEMGAHLSFANRREQGGEDVADVTARFSALRAVEVPESRAPAMIDEYPILAVAAAFAAGETVMRGLAELRVKESDRLAAIVDGLARCGVRAAIDGDTLRVTGGDTLRVTGGAVPGGGSVSTHGDHRIAMSFAMLGLAANAPVEVDRADMIATSFPGFADLMRGLGANLK